MNVAIVSLASAAAVRSVSYSIEFSPAMLNGNVVPFL